MTEKPEDYELFHFGVKGMKWGVRREDRPSASERKAARTENRQVKREAKATKFDAKADKLRSRIDNLKDVPMSDIKLSKSNARLIKKLEKKELRNIKDATNVRDGKMTRSQRNAAIGAAVAATYITYKVARHNVESGDFNRVVTKGKAFMQGKEATDFGSRNSLLSKVDLDEKAIKAFVVDGINPDYGGVGTKMNCRRCTFSYELRRRGYDVKATKTTKGTGQNALGLENALSPGKKEMGTTLPSILFNMAKEGSSKAKNPNSSTPFQEVLDRTSSSPFGRNKIERSDDDEDFTAKIFKSIDQQPDRSRGELGVQWKAGGGHSMAYEVINGKTVIFDGQTGKVYKTPEDFTKLGKNIADAGFTRLDNVDLNAEYLLKWVKNA